MVHDQDRPSSPSLEGLLSLRSRCYIRLMHPLRVANVPSLRQPGMATRHAFSAHAALIPLLHAARYPHETVIGCLLGPAVADSSGSQDRDIQYEHAVPLLHHWTGLSAAIEMAMTLVEEHAALQNRTILGFYFANEGLGETPLDPAKSNIPILIKRLMAQAGPEVTFFVLDNYNLTSPTLAFRLLSSSSSSASISFSDPKITPATLLALIKAGQHLKVDDFDAHLEDIGALWLENDNVDLNLSSENEQSDEKKVIAEK